MKKGRAKKQNKTREEGKLNKQIEKTKEIKSRMKKMKNARVKGEKRRGIMRNETRERKMKE